MSLPSINLQSDMLPNSPPPYRGSNPENVALDAALQPQPSGNLETFHCFGILPPELRRVIWAYLMPHPQILHFAWDTRNYFTNDEMRNSTRPLIKDELGTSLDRFVPPFGPRRPERSGQQRPAITGYPNSYSLSPGLWKCFSNHTSDFEITRVSREFRDILFERGYQLIDVLRSKRWFNFDTDTIFWESLGKRLDGDPLPEKLPISGPLLKRVKFLALDKRLWPCFDLIPVPRYLRGERSMESPAFSWKHKIFVDMDSVKELQLVWLPTDRMLSHFWSQESVFVIRPDFSRQEGVSYFDEQTRSIEQDLTFLGDENKIMRRPTINFVSAKTRTELDNFKKAGVLYSRVGG
ncbi:hypothetical protein B0J14DRAFT_643109 [Halenospora varia]|nr:hypothetical protein B0J14DRAFT_643109 [Halenospora varia]